MLAVRGVAVAYGPVTAVDHVDLTVPDGRVLALLGPSGCGKSTLLRAIAGLEPIAAGRISWDGRDLAEIPVHRRGFGLMFQDGVLFPHRSVAGNVAYGLQRAGRSADEIRSRVADLLDLVGLPGYQDRSVPTLSGGEAQRVALARALAPEPRLLLLDEPLAALDRSLRERLLHDLRSVLEVTRTTAVFVTHDQGEAFAVADEIALMRAGRLVQTGSPRAVWGSPVDEWAARFVGYDTVLDGPAAERVWCAGGAAEPLGSRGLAVRAAALVVDPAGKLHGRVLAVTPAPETLTLTVAVDGEGADGSATPVRGTARPDVAPVVGDRVSLRVDAAHLAVLSR